MLAQQPTRRAVLGGGAALVGALATATRTHAARRTLTPAAASPPAALPAATRRSIPRTTLVGVL